MRYLDDAPPARPERDSGAVVVAGISPAPARGPSRLLNACMCRCLLRERRRDGRLELAGATLDDLHWLAVERDVVVLVQRSLGLGGVGKDNGRDVVCELHALQCSLSPEKLL